MIEWIEAHDTLVVAGATVVIAAATLLSLLVTVYLAHENRLLRKAGTEPEVVAYLNTSEQYPTVINFVLANIGQGPAKNVRFAFDPEPHDFETHEVRLDNHEERTPITVLPQGARETMLFAVGANLFKQPQLAPFRVRVEYQNLKNAHRTAFFRLDINQFKEIRTVGLPAAYAIAEEMRRLVRLMERWGHGNINVTVHPGEQQARVYEDIEREER